MIYSMTGYGKGFAQSKNFSVEVEIKSINSRFLDIYLKAPSYLTNKEYEIREFIKSKVGRGKLTVFIQLNNSSSDAVNIVDNFPDQPIAVKQGVALIAYKPGGVLFENPANAFAFVVVPTVEN